MIKFILKMFLVVLLFAGLQSCETKPTQQHETTIPVEVAKLKEVGKFDTLLVIETDKNMYVFNKQNRDYSYTMERQHDNSSDVIAGLFLLLIILLGILVLAGFITLLTD